MCSWHVWKLPGVLGCFSSLCEYSCVFMEDTVGEDRDLCPFSGFFRQIWLARCWQLSSLLHTICLPFLMLIFLPLYTLFNLYFSSMHFCFLSFKPLLSKSHPSFSPDNTLLIPDNKQCIEKQCFSFSPTFYLFFLCFSAIPLISSFISHASLASTYCPSCLLHSTGTPFIYSSLHEPLLSQLSFWLIFPPPYFSTHFTLFLFYLDLTSFCFFLSFPT